VDSLPPIQISWIIQTWIILPIGEPHGTTLAKALEALHRRVENPIVLIIDEAQHALSSEKGADTLFALKAARDALNLAATRPQLAIVATGSARGKIADMVMRRNQAFYGATVETFPPLGEPFVRHLVSNMLSRRFPTTPKALAAVSVASPDQFPPWSGRHF
jgi:hypothetical protein